MRHIIITFCRTCIIWLISTMPLFAQSVDYHPLTKGGIPFLGGSTIGDPSIKNVLRAFFIISVGIAAVLAVIMLAIGGFKYMTSESAIRMGDAKSQISNAIIGLLIVLLSVTILVTIHPNIVAMDLFN